jgi:signal transduction histidine kinase
MFEHAEPDSPASLREALHRERALREMTRALAEHLDEERVLTLAVRQAAHLLGSAYARVWLFDPDGQLRCAAAEGYVHARTKDRRLDPDSISGQAARGYLLNVPDAPTLPEWRVSRDFGERTGVRAYLGAAIRRAGESLGVLEVMRPADEPFDDNDEALLLSLADVVAVSVANARQAGALRALAVDNRRLLRQTEQALRERDRFVVAAAHELRAPLSRLKGHIEVLLAMQADGEVAPQQLKRSLQRMESAIDALSRLTSDLLDLRRPSRKLALHRQTVDLVELVRDAVADGHTLPGARVDLLVETPPEAVFVSADRQRLEQVLTNLLDNAAKYSPEGGTVDVILSRDANGVRLMVRDHGIGLPPGEAESIFEPFRRAANAQGIPGLGLGLAICRQIIQQHGGRIWAESPGEDQGTSVCVWLPTASPGAARHRVRA